MKKKVYYVGLIFCLVLAGMILSSIGTKSNAYSQVINGKTWYYSLSGGLAINVYTNNNTASDLTVEIPTVLGTYPVSSISPSSGCFNSSYVKAFALSGESEYLSIEDGVLYNKDKTLLLRYPVGKECSDEFVIPSTVTGISNYAFYYSKSLSGSVVFPEGLTTIGSNAFQMSSISGDIVIGDNLTTLGSYAFANCSNLKGTVSIGNGLGTINQYTFRNSAGIQRFYFGSGLRNISNNVFDSYSPNYGEVFIDALQSEVYVGSYTYFYGRFHWKDETHYLNVATVPGVKMINTETNEEIVSGDYLCGTSFKFKYVLDPAYSYDSLSELRIDDGNYEKITYSSVLFDTEMNFDELIRDRDLLLQCVSGESDLALRTFISEVNRKSLVNSRYPVVSLNNGKLSYNHIKSSVPVKTGDSVTYKVRVYNEGFEVGYAKKVSVFIPEGFAFDSTNKTNIINGWVLEGDNKLSTTKLASTAIKGYKGNINPDFEDLSLYLIVTKKKEEITDEGFRMAVIAEISESDEDSDSTPGTITSGVDGNYKKEEAELSSSKSFIRGNEDDDDFDAVLVAGPIKIDYAIKINKIDTDTKFLLSQAKFALLDEEKKVLRTATTDETGTLNFGTISTYGEGEDVYYIKEIEAPVGFVGITTEEIKVTIVKTIIDEATKTYSIKVICDALNYNVDTTRYEFTPIFTAEQLKMIGTGNTVTIDGVNYQYNLDTNYKLMADIDLQGEEWTPIDRELKCIIDGKDHKISNLTITKTDAMPYQNIGLISKFSGIIQNLELENVNIEVGPMMKESSTTSDPVYGIGAFAGVMEEGYLINCKVSGSVSAKTSNVGGFVGHTVEAKKVEAVDCVNNATVTAIVRPYVSGDTNAYVTSGNNAGGIIGCALGATRFANCENNGAVTVSNYCAGGLVGLTNSTDYEEVDIKADFEETDKLIDLVVENKNITGKYDVELENLDGSTNGLIKGAVYDVLDENKKVMPGLSNVVLVDGKIKVATIDIEALGTDTYFIKEVQPAEGYDPLGTYIKLDVRRYWDEVERRYKVSVEKENVDYGDLPNVVVPPSDDDNPSITNEVFTKVTFENVSWNSDKAEFVKCNNKGNITSNYAHAGGLLGQSKCVVEMTECSNSGTIYSKSIAAGLVGHIFTEDTKVKSKIMDCSNSGTIDAGTNEQYSSTGSAGGIVSYLVGFASIKNCSNTADITAKNGKASGGIVGDGQGTIEIMNCQNSGVISAIETSVHNSNVNSPAGGIIGKNYLNTYVTTMSRNDHNIKISDCKNTGNINANAHFGGILGLSTAFTAEISGCEVSNIVGIDYSNADKGGIVGATDNAVLRITDCIVDKVDLHRDVSQTGTYGGTGGIVGNIGKYLDSSNADNIEVTISGCTITDGDFKCYDKEVAGVVGIFHTNEGITEINISDCLVDNCSFLNDQTRGTYGNSGGLVGMIYGAGDISVKSCTVQKSNVKSIHYSGSDQNASGFVTDIMRSKNVTFVDNDIIECIVENDVKGNKSTCDNVAGFMTCCMDNVASGVRLTFDNCNIKDSRIFGDSYDSAGIIVHTWDGILLSIKNCTVEGTTIENNMQDATSMTETNASAITAMPVGWYEIIGCKVIDCSIKNGRNTGAAVSVSYANTYNGKVPVIENFVLKNTDITGTTFEDPNDTGNCDYNSRVNTAVGGVIGYLNGNVKLKNIEIEGVDLLAKAQGNSGLLAASLAQQNDYQFDNIKVTDCTVESRQKYDRVMYTSNSTCGGLIGTISKFNMNNVEVNNLTVTGANRNVGGIVGMQFGQEMSGNNYKLNNITVTSLMENPCENPLSQRAVGGFAGGLNGSNLSNINMKDITVTTNAANNGGFAGYGANANLSDIVIDNLDLNSSFIPYSSSQCSVGDVGGLLGTLNYANNDIHDVVVKNSNIEADCFKIGGLIGTVSTMDYEKIEVLDNCNVENTIITQNNTVSYALTTEAAGMIANTVTPVNIKNSTIKDSSVTVNYSENSPQRTIHAGGVIGFMKNDNTLTNVTVNNVDVINNTPYGVTGGVVGLTDKTKNTETNVDIVSVLTTDNVVVKGNSTVNGNSHVGGILGFGAINSNNDSVLNTTITSNGDSYTDVGGIIGNSFNYEGVGIKSPIITNVVVRSAYRAGGVAGLCNLDISNATVTGGTVETTNSSMDVGGISGIVDGKYTISGSKVDGITIKGVNGYIGGISSFTKGTISNSSVKNSTITATGDAPTGIGGIVGLLDVAVSNATVSECTVENNTLTSSDKTGDMIGGAQASGTSVENNTEIGEVGEIIEESKSEEYSEELKEVKKENEKIDDEKEDILEEVKEEVKEELKEENIKEDNFEESSEEKEEIEAEVSNEKETLEETKDENKEETKDESIIEKEENVNEDKDDEIDEEK